MFGFIVAMMQKVAIFGAAGAIGHAVAGELAGRGIPFRVVGRTRARLATFLPTAEVVEADLADVRSAADAARGADTIIYAVGAPYPRFDLHPRFMRSAIEGAAAAGAQRMAVVSSVYSYGVPETPRVAETHPRAPHTVKGRYRKEQEDIALAANGHRGLRTLVLRLPDFYGPHAESSLAHEVFKAALAGKTANWLGPASTPHEFVFVPDAGRVLADLVSREDAWGEAWNFGGPGEITGAGFIQKVYRAAGREPKFRTAGRTLLKVAGWFSPLMRELPEMLYLQETPVILDDAKLERLLGPLRKTSYDEGIQRTIEWMRRPKSSTSALR